MATQLSHQLMSALPQLRWESTPKRVRALSGGATVLDSRNCRLVWEPKRIVPSYAVPEADIQASLIDTTGTKAHEHPVQLSAGGPPVLDPRTPFAVHTVEGQPLSLDTGAGLLDGAGFRAADPDLDAYVLLDFDAFDTWLEEDEPIVGHPRDPFHRIDIRRSSSPVRVEVGGEVLADTTGARLLFETHITPRFYVPREDVRMDLLTPTTTRTTCAYKGHASYWAVSMNGTTHSDLAWTYTEPLSDARDVAGMVAFFDERVDVVLDGVRRERPVTPWS